MAMVVAKADAPTLTRLLPTSRVESRRSLFCSSSSKFLTWGCLDFSISKRSNWPRLIMALSTPEKKAEQPSNTKRMKKLITNRSLFHLRGLFFLFGRWRGFLGRFVKQHSAAGGAHAGTSLDDVVKDLRPNRHGAAVAHGGTDLDRCRGYVAGNQGFVFLQQVCRHQGAKLVDQLHRKGNLAEHLLFFLVCCAKLVGQGGQLVVINR